MDAAILDNIIDRLLDARNRADGTQIPFAESEIRQLCSVSSDIFLNQPPLLQLEAPMMIAGDIHGQYFDLLRLFESAGYPPHSNYLFLGNYVDFGRQSVETILLLLAYKIKYPDNFFLLRGNHESSEMNRIYGFYDECKRKYNVKTWKTFVHCFKCLPFAALISGKIICMHGGLSPELDNLDQIRNLMRPTDVPDSGLVYDLLWSDPSEDQGWGFKHLEPYQDSCTFGSDIVDEFLTKHDLDLICCSNQVVEDGYEFFASGQLVTIFSAPKFRVDNNGSVLSVDVTLGCQFLILKPF